MPPGAPFFAIPFRSKHILPSLQHVQGYCLSVVSRPVLCQGFQGLGAPSLMVFKGGDFGLIRDDGDKYENQKPHPRTNREDGAPEIQNQTKGCVALPDGTRLGFDKYIVLHTQVARGWRKDCLGPDEDFFAARHRAPHVIFADERGNLNGGHRLGLEL